MRAEPGTSRSPATPPVAWAPRRPRPLAWTPPPEVAGWQLGPLLGRGRASLVHQAWSASGGSVALKLASLQQLQARGASRGFRAEFALSQQLGHPHLLRLQGHGIDGDTAWMAMELASASMCGAQPAAAIPAWLAQVAGALDALHAAGWTHRDLKSANLLCRANGQLALADFGSASRIGQPTPAGRLSGSAPYAAPEQSRGGAASPAADWYALGVVLHEWLTGALPFPGQTLVELQAQHLLAPLPRLSPSRAAWQPLLDALLSKDPKVRPANGRAVLAALPDPGTVALEPAPSP